MLDRLYYVIGTEFQSESEVLRYFVYFTPSLARSEGAKKEFTDNPFTSNTMIKYNIPSNGTNTHYTKSCDHFHNNRKLDRPLIITVLKVSYISMQTQ